MVRRADVEVAAGARVTLGAAAPVFPSALRLVHEDEDLLVVEKPPGLLTIATERERGRTAYRLLFDYLHPRARLFIVHRLDRETSGLLVFAKSAAVKRALQAQFAARTVERGYVALVEGRVRDDAGTLRDRVAEDPATLRVRTVRGGRGREAITVYRVRERRARSTLLELSLGTGRRGQIRAHLAALGHPIVGDRAFGAATDPVHRVCLHASLLAFADARGRPRRFTSPEPPAFSRA
ncbi:MAG TPA: RluA family pseudouridine synthase [Methylomirabilota bacterium]|nr:RluA family pseudouridine synthase [Methylomirabilota bacterium]